MSQRRKARRAHGLKSRTQIQKEIDLAKEMITWTKWWEIRSRWRIRRAIERMEYDVKKLKPWN
tara:strand:- start:16798 stop:16986 length:189 start_codon:yes stop_codon:yes gene_type:complete